MKYCTYCGKALVDGAAFCSSCGKEVVSATEPKSEHTTSSKSEHTTSSKSERTTSAAKAKPALTEAQIKEERRKNAPSTAAKVISFLLPPIGLIILLCNMGDMPGKMRSAAEGLLAWLGLACPFFAMVLFFVWNDDEDKKHYAKCAGRACLFGYAVWAVISVVLVLGLAAAA